MAMFAGPVAPVAFAQVTGIIARFRSDFTCAALQRPTSANRLGRACTAGDSSVGARADRDGVVA